MKKKQKGPPLETGLRAAMRALDSQIAREMQRSPQELSQQGVLKFEPHRKRVEDVTTLVLQYMADQEVQLDSLLVLSQAFAKALQLWSVELDIEGLGAVRAEYCRHAAENIRRDAERSLDELTQDRKPVVS